MSKQPAVASPASHRDKLAGKTIANRYMIERLIARGGMAAVYQAHQVQLNRKIAIKILRPPPDTEQGASFHDRFRLEAETLAQLNHPNIVTVYDHGDFDDDQVFLAMEYVDGVRLTDLLRDGPLTVERSLHLLLQVCEALRYAHRRGVVHRDLKPSNLLITRTDDDDELVKVVDFGLVKLTEVDVTITSAGLILGSPHCMAPEQVRGQDVDPRTDIYAMGILLFRALTGTYPFHGANSTATMIAHLNQATPTFFSVAPDLEVPDGLENVCRRCLAKNPNQRFQSMDELQDALAYFLNISPDQYRTVTRTHSTLERIRVPGVSPRRTPMVVYGIGVVGALLLLGGIVAAGVLTGAWLYSGSGAVVDTSTVETRTMDEPAGAPQTPQEDAPDDPGLTRSGDEETAGDQGADVAPADAPPEVADTPDEVAKPKVVRQKTKPKVVRATTPDPTPAEVGTTPDSSSGDASEQGEGEGFELGKGLKTDMDW